MKINYLAATGVRRIRILGAARNVNYNLMVAMYYIFKLAAPVVSCVAICLGYRLFMNEYL
jgi:hypothetical protein